MFYNIWLDSGKIEICSPHTKKHSTLPGEVAPAWTWREAKLKQTTWILWNYTTVANRDDWNAYEFCFVTESDATLHYMPLYNLNPCIFEYIFETLEARTDIGLCSDMLTHCLAVRTNNKNFFAFLQLAKLLLETRQWIVKKKKTRLISSALLIETLLQEIKLISAVIAWNGMVKYTKPNSYTLLLETVWRNWQSQTAIYFIAWNLYEEGKMSTDILYCLKLL